MIKDFIEKVKTQRLNKINTIILLIILLSPLIILLFWFSSNIIEGYILTILIFFIFIGVYSLVFMRIICKRSEIIFVRENPIIFQLIIVLLISIMIGTMFARIFYPPVLPKNIQLGQLIYTNVNNSNESIISPFVKIKCYQAGSKEPVEGSFLNCKIVDSGSGTKGASIDYVEIKSNSNTAYLRFSYPENSIKLSRDQNYSLRAVYSGGDISLILLNGSDILTVDEYRDLTFKRISIMGVFLVFSIGALTSFLKNINEMIKKEKKSSKED
mgnify:CR=1 FL=1